MVMRSSLHHLGLETPDPAALAVFYADAMGIQVRDGDAGAKICTATDRRLVLLPGQPKGLRYAAYAVETADALKALRQDIQKTGVAIQPGGSPLFDDAFSIADPDGTKIIFGVPGTKTTGGDLPARLQ